MNHVSDKQLLTDFTASARCEHILPVVYSIQILQNNIKKGTFISAVVTL